MKIKQLDLDLLPQVKSQELRAKRRVLSRTLEGSWTALLKGRGMEFAGYREYTNSDDASRIDWGASLRANETLVREFEEYKNVNVMFLVDVGDTMCFSSQQKLKAEYAAELVFNLALAVLDNGDSVGYGMFSDGLVSKSLPDIGRAVVYAMAANLQKPELYGAKKNMGKVVTTLDSMLKHRALVIMVSDFIGMGEGWERYLKMVAEKFDLIGIRVRDPRDRTLPDSGTQMLLQDPHTGERMFVDTKDTRQLYEDQALEDEAYVKSVFGASKAGYVSVMTDDDLFQPVINYFRKRAAIIRG